MNTEVQCARLTDLLSGTIETHFRLLLVRKENPLTGKEIHLQKNIIDNSEKKRLQ